MGELVSSLPITQNGTRAGYPVNVPLAELLPMLLKPEALKYIVPDVPMLSSSYVPFTDALPPE